MHPDHPRASRRGLAIALIALIVTLLAASGAAAGTTGAWVTRVFSVTHAAVTTDLVTPGSDGHQLGDVRVNVATPTYDEQGEMVGRYDAMLITTSIDYPARGDEVRMVQLNFVFGDAQADQLAGSADQLIVSGSGFYPAGGSTFVAGAALVRTIAGGSGDYAGATGWAESEHLQDGSWRHTFHVLQPAGIAVDEAAGQAPAPSPMDHAAMTPTASAAPGEFARVLVGSVEPATAPGETLTLWYYFIPAGFQLPLHHHPGYQVAKVTAGTLTFHVVEGSAIWVHGDGSQETIEAGAVVALQTGDAVIENPDLVHFGGNDGTVPVELYTSTLFTTGETPAIAVPTPSPAA
jgi:hypothetical protein